MEGSNRAEYWRSLTAHACGFLNRAGRIVSAWLRNHFGGLPVDGQYLSDKKYGAWKWLTVTLKP